MMHPTWPLLCPLCNLVHGDAQAYNPSRYPRPLSIFSAPFSFTNTDDAVAAPTAVIPISAPTLDPLGMYDTGVSGNQLIVRQTGYYVVEACLEFHGNTVNKAGGCLAINIDATQPKFFPNTNFAIRGWYSGGVHYEQTKRISQIINKDQKITLRGGKASDGGIDAILQQCVLLVTFVPTPAYPR